MSNPLRRQLEIALYKYAKAKLPQRLKDLGFVEGHSNSEPTLPYHCVHVASSGPHESMPSETGIRKCLVTWFLKTEANDEERAKADDRLQGIYEFLAQPLDTAAPFSDENREFGALLAALNKPETGPDLREVKQLHLYDFTLSDDSGATDGDAWHDSLSFEVVCQPFDSH